MEELERKQNTYFALSHVNLLTYYQLEDPLWYWLRASCCLCPATTNGILELCIDYYPDKADFWPSCNARHCFRN